jgi:hypothetical protein
MRTALFIAGALALAAAPALSQEAPAPAPPPASSNYVPPQYNSFANSPYVGTDGVKQCFAIGPVTAANRAGKTVYLQDRKGAIFRIDLAEPCGALDAAQKISVRSRGLDVCEGGPAILMVKTTAGSKRCAIKEVRRPNKAEVTKLASASQR